MDRREFIGLASRCVSTFVLFLLFPAWAFEATSAPPSKEEGRNSWVKPDYYYPPVSDPQYPKNGREKILARRKIHDVVNEAVDKLFAEEGKRIPKEKLDELKKETAKAYENILKREFFLHDDP